MQFSSRHHHVTCCWHSYLNTCRSIDTEYPEQPAHALIRAPTATHPLPMLLPLLSLHASMEGRFFVTCAICVTGNRSQAHHCAVNKLKLRNALQADCDFTVKLVHASAADLDLERLGATNIKKPSTKYDNPVLSVCVCVCV